MRATISLILTPTGQSSWQPGRAQAMHRVASVTAAGAESPWLTSAKLCARTSALSSGIRARGILIRSFAGSGLASDMMGLSLRFPSLFFEPLFFEFRAQLRAFLFLRDHRGAMSCQLLLPVLLKCLQRLALPAAVHGVALHQHV